MYGFLLRKDSELCFPKCKLHFGIALWNEIELTKDSKSCIL